MADDGFDIKELDNYTKKLLNLANDKMPKESKKFIKKESIKLNKENKKEGQKIGYVTGSFEKGFKSGKVYKFDGSWCSRAYNSSPHAHLLNDGYMWTPHKNKHLQPNATEHWVPGFHFLEDAAKKFESGYYKNCEDFIDDMLDKGL